MSVEEPYMLKNFPGRSFLFENNEPFTDEVADGVFETRRSMLLLPFAAAALMLTSGSSAKAQTMASQGKLGWDEFLKQSVPTAIELHKDSSAAGQDAYLFWLASMSSRLDIASMPKGKLGSFANLDPPVEAGPAYFGKPFFIIEWRMAPNAYLPPHNHPNGSVCTVCTDGDARIRNFQPEGATPEFASKDTFRVRETHDELLTAGRINNLSAVRDNIHTFKAGKKGARGFDISTYHGKDAGFSFLEIGNKPLQMDERTFEAYWVKR